MHRQGAHTFPHHTLCRRGVSLTHTSRGLFRPLSDTHSSLPRPLSYTHKLGSIIGEGACIGKVHTLSRRGQRAQGAHLLVATCRAHPLTAWPTCAPGQHAHLLAGWPQSAYTHTSCALTHTTPSCIGKMYTPSLCLIHALYIGNVHTLTPLVRKAHTHSIGRCPLVSHSSGRC